MEPKSSLVSSSPECPSQSGRLPRLPLAVVDAFAERPFEGNPAAVCCLDGTYEDEWMQAVAGEMNLSETAFLQRCGDEFGLRWFTPVAEVDLCGHATLASAHFLWSTGRLEADAEGRFFTRSGLLTARRGKDGMIWLDFPATPTSPLSESPFSGSSDSTGSSSLVGPSEVTSAVDAEDGEGGAQQEARLRSSLEGALGTEIVSLESSAFDLLVEVQDAQTLGSLQPDLVALGQIEARGIIVTAPGGPEGIDFVSRFFGPRVGVPEDPVTGSAHCALGPYWQRRMGRKAFRARQLSKRGGEVAVRVEGEAGDPEARVALGGRAITVWQGEWLAPIE